MTKFELKKIIMEAVKQAVREELVDIKKLINELIKNEKLNQKINEHRNSDIPVQKKPEYIRPKKKHNIQFTNNDILNEILNETEPLRETIPTMNPVSYDEDFDVLNEETVPTLNNRPFTTQDVIPSIAPIPQLANVPTENIPAEATMQFANMNFRAAMKKVNNEADRIRREGGGKMPL